jgi:hypothetical protein
LREADGVLGAVIIVIVLLVVLPVGFLVGGAVVAGLLGSALDADRNVE